jgi:hypothetical protein
VPGPLAPPGTHMNQHHRHPGSKIAR